MKKTLATVACAVALVTTLSLVPTSSKLGLFGVDVVSAATEAAPTTTPAAPKPSNTASTSVSYTSGSISRILAVGSNGSDVKLLQTALNSKGYKLTADGFFGPLTSNAVKAFQKDNNLLTDGIAGPKTIAVLMPSTSVPTVIVQVGSSGSAVNYLQTNLNKLGYKLSVDGIFGNLTSNAVKGFQKDNGLTVDGIAGPKTFAKLAEKIAPVAPTAPTTPSAPSTPVTGQTSIKIGRAEYAAHGTKCFTVAVVAMAGDKIAAVSVDDYQFAASTDFKGVPNSDKDFGKSYPAGQVLISKRTNTDAYSANMSKSGGATQTWIANMSGIEKFATGKTIAELEGIVKANTGVDAKVDAVASATFTDTNGYLNAIVAAAKDAKENTSVQIDAAQVSSLKIGRAEYAAHGTKCFSVAVAVLAGDKIVADSVDDYQFTAPTGFVGVPNSDKDFGKSYPAGQILISKRTNAAAYSANMAKSGGATLTWDANMSGIEKFATGKTIAELEAVIKANTGVDAKVDAVASATFADTNGYLNAIDAAAKDAK